MKINQIISFHIILILPTWLCKNDYVSLIKSTCPSHVNTQLETLAEKCGVEAIINSAILIKPDPKLNFSSFENVILSIADPTMKTLKPTIFVLMSRAPGPYSELLSEFSDFLSALVFKTDKVIIVEGFNMLRTTALVLCLCQCLIHLVFASMYKNQLTFLITPLILF